MNRDIPMITYNEPSVNDIAAQNVMLSNMAGQDGNKVAAAYQYEKETGLSYRYWQMADNRNIHPVFDPSTLHPRLVDIIAQRPEFVPFLKDSTPDWNKVMEALEKLPNREEQMPAPQEEEFHRSPWNAYDIEQYKNFSPFDHSATESATTPEQRAEIKAQTDKEIRIGALMRVMQGYLTEKQFKNTTDEDLQRAFTELGKIHNIRTDDISVADFREMGVFSGGLKPSELVNFFGIIEGAKALERLADPNLRPQNLANVDENSPVYLQLAKLEMLKEENDMMRGLTKPAEVTNSVMMSMRLMAEMMAMGGISKGVMEAATTNYRAILADSGVKGAISKFAENLGKGLLGIAEHNVKRAPIFAAQAAAEAYNRDYLGGLVSVIDENGVSVQATEPELQDFWLGLATHMFEHVNEMATEEMGDLLPLSHLSYFVPRRFRNAVIARLGMDPMARHITYSWLKKGVPISGATGEWMEEEIAQFNSRVATIVMEEVNKWVGNDVPITPGTENASILFGDARERSVTAWSLGLQQVLFGGAAFVGNYARGYRPHPLRPIEARARFLREKEGINEAVTQLPHTPLVNTPAVMRDVLDSAVGDAIWVFPFEEADALHQQANSNETTPEDKEDMKGALRAMGITEKALENAKKNGTDLLLSRNAVISVMSHGKFKSARDLGNRIMDNAINAEYGVFGVKNIEITKGTFDKKMLDEMDRIAAEQAEFGAENLDTIRNAINKAQADEEERARAEGRPEFAMRESFTKSLEGYYSLMNCIMRYLWVGSKTEAKAAVKDMIEKLSFRFAESPEQFNLQKAYADTEAAVRRVKENGDRLGAAEARYREAIAKFGEEEKKQQERQKADPNAVDVEQSYTDAFNELQEATNELQDARAKSDEAKLNQLAGPKAAQRLDAEEGTTDRMDNLKVAETMDAAKLDATTIWLATGWNKQKDGKFVFELPDMKVNVANLAESMSTILVKKLGDFAFAEEIFKAYPELKNYNVEFIPMKDHNDLGFMDDARHLIAFNTNSFWDRGLGEIRQSRDESVRNAAAEKLAKEILPTLIHEVQHAIQRIEGFAPGSNEKVAAQIKNEDDPALTRRRDEINKLTEEMDKMSEEIFDWISKNVEAPRAMEGSIIGAFEADEDNLEFFVNRFNKWHGKKEGAGHILDLIREVNRKLSRTEELFQEMQKESTAFRKYKRTAGEVQSRNAEFRAGLSDKSRREIPPSETEDVPREDQIVLEQDKPLFQGVIGIPGFYSNMMQAIQDAPQQKMTPAQWLAYLQKSGGMKVAEVSWRGSIEDFFRGRDPNVAIDKQELIDEFQDGMVDLLEIEGGASSEVYAKRHAELFRQKRARINYVTGEVFNESQTSPLRAALRDLVFKEDESRNLPWKEWAKAKQVLVKAGERLQKAFEEVYNKNVTELSIANRGAERSIARIRAGFEYWTEERLQDIGTISDSEFEKRMEECNDAMDAAADKVQGEPGDAELLRLIAEESDAQKKLNDSITGKIAQISGSEVRNNYTTKGLDDLHEIVIYSPEISPWDPGDRVHFGDATGGRAIAWVRFGETTDADGKRVLVIDEIQSNRHQEGREKGYKVDRKPDGEFGAVHNAYIDSIQKDPLNGGVVFWITVHDANDSNRYGEFGIKDGIIENYDNPSYTEHPDFEDLIGKDVRAAFGEKVAEWYNALNEESKKLDDDDVERWQEYESPREVLVDDRILPSYDAVPAAPFEKNWQELGMKRMIRYAAENGFDKVAWTSGNQQAKRYNIGKVLSSVERRGHRTLVVGDHLVSTWGYANQEDIEEIGFNEDEAWFLLVLLDELDRRGSFGAAMQNALAAIEAVDDRDLRSGSKEDLRDFAKKVKLKGEGREFFANRQGGGKIKFSVDENGIVDSSSMGEFEGKDVRELFGKELGNQIMDIANNKADNDMIQLDENVVIGGEGMKTFYDKILRNFTDKYIKKWGSKVGVVELPNVEEAGREMWGFDVTDKMKEDVMTKGQPLFQDRGPARAASYGLTNIEKFAECHEALIVLFKNADASTLPHESAHWLLTAMRALVNGGLGTEKMEQDLKTIDAWLTKQEYTAEAARRQGLLHPREDGTEYFDVKEMEQEYFARAFEHYLHNGVLPETATSKLKTALRRLADFFLAIYDDAKKLDVQMDPSITQFFDSIIATDYVSEKNSVLSDILQAINEGALGMSNEEVTNLEKALEGVREDSEAERWLVTFKAYLQGVKELTPRWKRDANAAYDASKVEKAFVYVKGKGHKLYEGFLRENGFTEETIQKLRDKGLTVKNPYRPVEPGESVEPNAPKQEAPAPAEQTPVAEEPEEAETRRASDEEIAGATVLDGSSMQFDGIANDTFVKLPEGQGEAEKIASDLLGDQASGPLGRIINYQPISPETGVNKTSALFELYKALLTLFQRSGAVKKGDLARYLHTTLTNVEKSKPREINRHKTESFEGSEEDNENGRAPEQKIGTEDQNDLSDLTTALRGFPETLEDKEDKLIAAAMIEKMISDYLGGKVDNTLDEYKKRGGVLEKTAFYKRMANLGDALRKYLRDHDITPMYQKGAETEAPQYIMKTLQDLGYETVDDLVSDLLMAKGKDAFISDFMAQKLDEYKRAFMESPEWNSDAGALKYLDAIMDALKLTKGMKFSQRVAAETDRAEREMKAEKTVGEMLKLQTVRAIETSLKSSVARLLKTIKTNKGNREAAVDAAVEVHRLAAQLKVARQLHTEVEKMLRKAKRFGKTKAGVTIDGDALNAIKALNRHFGLSNAKPNWTTRPGDPKTPYQVVQEMVRLRAEPMRFENEAEKQAYIAEVTNGIMSQWSDKMQAAMLLPSNEANPNVEPFTDMKYDEFEELGKVLKFLYKASRDMMESVDGSFASELKKRKDAIFGEMAENKTGDYSELDEVSGWEKTKSRVRSGLHIGKSLQWFAHLFSGYKEFYGKHDLGAFRRYFELPIAEGESKQFYWQEKISKEVKPHLEALMRSAKERGISAKVNNEDAIRHAGYGATIKGKAMAFILLNAGNLGNRQRLMSGYGWSEDELNGILAQFSEEDFKHADAIWASLAKLGSEMADVFYKERHYRMKHVDAATIELTNYEGKRIVSQGGYYPLAYKYSGVKSSEDFDIMNPPHRPEKMAEPSSTKDRAEKVEDRFVRLDWSVLNKHIHEGARYIGLWEPLRMANAIYRDKQFYRSVTENFGREAYDVFAKLMDFVNNPDQRFKYGKIANRVASIMATAALGFKVTTMEKQWASLWVGVDRLGNAGYFTDAFESFWSNPKAFVDAVSEISPFIRDRYNLIDRDLTVLDTEFKKPIEQFEDKYRQLAFLGMKKMDLCVAAIQWQAAFDFAQNTYKDMTISMCRAWADDFVASSQGAARTIDIPAVQLDAIGRMLTPFFGPACAAANTRIAGLSVYGKMDAGERLSFAVENFVVPALMCAFIMAVANGLFRIDDDDDWDRVRRSFFRNLLAEPISGIPYVQDVADAMIGVFVDGRAGGRNVFEVGMLRPAEDMMSDAKKILVNLRNLDNLDQSLYIGARIAGEWYGITVIQAAEDYEKMAIRNHFYPFDKSIEKTLGDN